MAPTEDGHVEVCGRWFGVRGRRFVRPSLIVTVGEDEVERRWLADLEHKPWAAEDGELWTAAFPLEVDLDAATAIELAVAPDIEITLRSAGADTSRRSALGAPGARTSLAKHPEPSARRPSARALDLERLTTRLAAAEAALARERARRTGAEQSLEAQRSETRGLSAELGRARAELDLARTVQLQLEAMAAELDATRSQLRGVQAHHDQLNQEHDQLNQEHDQLNQEHDQLSQEHDQLGQEQERVAEQLRTARRQAATAPTESYLPSVADDPHRPPGAPPWDRLSLSGELASPSPEPVRVVPRRPAPVHRTPRPLNPALRPRPNWFWRIVAVLVFAAVIVAVYMVLHSTILHH